MWKITPLDVGTLNVTSGAQTYKHGVRQNVGQVIEVPCIVWLLTNENDGRKILVDAGPAEDSQWGSIYHNPISRSADQQLKAVLANHNTQLEEIKTVILTHLHWDHAYGILKMPQSKVIVQSEELRYAIDPLPSDIKHYELNIKSQLPYFLKFFNQIQTVKGDKVIDEGIMLVFLPGHTPGSQGVVIDTKEGKYLIAGDLINATENWKLKLPGGIYYDIRACYDSFEKMENIDATILPSHDYKAFEMIK